MNRRCSAGSRACRGVYGSGICFRANHGAIRLLRSHVERKDRTALRRDWCELVCDPRVGGERRCLAVVQAPVRPRNDSSARKERQRTSLNIARKVLVRPRVCFSLASPRQAGRRPVARYRIGNRLRDLRICWTGGWRVPSALICLRRTYPPRWTRPCVGDDRVQWNLFTVILLTLPAAFHGRMSSLWTASCVVTRTASDSSMNRSVMQSGSWRCRTRETSGTSGSGFGFRTLGGRSAETPSARSFIPRRRWRAKFAARVSNCSGAAARGPGALTYT